MTTFHHATIALLFAVAVSAPRTLGQTKAQEEDKVDQIFAAYDKPNSPGCALGVVRDGKFVYKKSYGMASLELRSEEHTSELQSQSNLVCRLLLEKKKKKQL